MKKIVIISIILFIILFSPRKIMAASNLGLFVSPPTQQITVEKGNTDTGSITLMNHTPNFLHIQATASDFVVNNTEGIPEFLSSSLGNRFSAADWIKMSHQTFTLAPEEKKIVSYTITVPVNAASGGHYAAVIFTANGINQDNAANAKITLGVASLLSLTVPGAIRESLIGTMEVPVFQEYGPVKINTTLTNTGDIDLIPQGSLTIKNMFGQVVSTTQVEAQHIFPEASKTYEFTFPGKWHAGRYNAIFNLKYGNNQVLTTQETFIIFPWSLALIIVLSFVALILFILVLIKKTDINPNASETPLSPLEKK